MKYRFRAFALGFMCALFLMGCEEKVPPRESVRPVRAMKVGDASGYKGRFFPGQAKATKEVELSFRVSGPLITRPIYVGDEVENGQVLARIDPRDFEVNVRNVEGQLAKAKAELERAQSEYDRVLRIQKQDPGAVSQTMIDRKLRDVSGTKAEIKSLVAALDSAKDQLRYTHLEAPFDGTVVSIYVENYEYVKAKQPIVRVVDDSRIEMIVNIPEDLISYADKLERIWTRFDPFPDIELEAQIKEIGKEASETTRTYPVTLVMDQPEDAKILPGMAGRAWGEGDRPGETGREIVVPETAVFSSDETQKTYVWVIDGKTKTVGRREIKTGPLSEFGIMIQEGLETGEWVATAGVHYLREGQEVAILEQSPKEVLQ